MILALVATALLTFLLVESVAYGVHKVAHSPKSGALFRNHLHHHSQAYPPSRFQAESYLGDLKTSFLPVFIPLFFVVNVLAAAVLSWPCFLVFFVVSSAGSLVNNYLHDSYHISTHWLRRFGWYHRLAGMHRIHHENVKKNLSIYWYGFDRLVGSIRFPSNQQNHSTLS